MVPVPLSRVKKLLLCTDNFFIRPCTSEDSGQIVYLTKWDENTFAYIYQKSLQLVNWATADPAVINCCSHQKQTCFTGLLQKWLCDFIYIFPCFLPLHLSMHLSMCPWWEELKHESIRFVMAHGGVGRMYLLVLRIDRLGFKVTVI